MHLPKGGWGERGHGWCGGLGYGYGSNLTPEQKEKLQDALADGRERIGEYLKTHPNTTKADIVAKVKEHRGQIHERIAKFLDSEQLGKWDNEVAKAKEFLGQKLDS